MGDRFLTVVTDRPARPIARNRDGPGRIRELDRVELRTDVLGDDRVIVSAGTVGTVIAI